MCATSTIQKQHDIFSAGDWLYWKCEFEKARDHFQAVSKRRSLSPSDLARCYKSLAAAEVELKNYDEALNIYNKQLDILEGISDSKSKNDDIISCCISMGKVYWLTSDYDQAIAYHHRALEYAQTEPRSPSRLSSIYKNLANIYTNTKEFDLALEYFQKVLKIDSEHLPINYPQLGQTYANMAMMYQSEKNYKEALHYFNKARESLLKKVPTTHVAIEKIDKTLQKVESKLTHPNPPAPPPVTIKPVKIWDILVRNNIMVLWLDEHIGRDENCRALKAEFHQIINSLKIVDSVESCREVLRYVKDRKLFCIIQGKHAKEIVPDIVKNTSSSSLKPIVYIFCLHMIHLTEWAQEQECIMDGGIFVHEKDLLERLNSDLNDYVKQKSIEYESCFQSELVSKFLTEFTQIFERYYKERNAIIKDQNQATTTVA